MTAASTILETAPRGVRGMGRGTNPLRPVPEELGAVRRNAQLPSFAPLLDELEIAGWSSHRRVLGGNFHDWLLLDGGGVMVVVGQAAGTGPVDATEAALVSQAAWAAVRAHALHTRDAGVLLSLAARSLWPIPNAGVSAAVAVAILDSAEGHGSVAMAGDCLAWTVRAATTEQFAICQPPLGGFGDFAYRSQPLQLSLRERLLLVADDAQHREPKLCSVIENDFAQIDAESHRRMMASDAVSLVREHFDGGAAPGDERGSTSIVAVRRR